MKSIPPLSLVGHNYNKNSNCLSAAQLMIQFEAKSPLYNVCQTKRLNRSTKMMKSPQISAKISNLSSPKSQRLLRSAEQQSPFKMSINNKENITRFTKTNSQSLLVQNKINIGSIIKEIKKDKGSRHSWKENININKKNNRCNQRNANKINIINKIQNYRKNKNVESMVSKKLQSHESAIKRQSQMTFDEEQDLYKKSSLSLLPTIIKTENEISLTEALAEAKNRLYRHIYNLDKKILNEYEEAPNKKDIIILIKRKTKK